MRSMPKSGMRFLSRPFLRHQGVVGLGHHDRRLRLDRWNGEESLMVCGLSRRTGTRTSSSTGTGFRLGLNQLSDIALPMAADLRWTVVSGQLMDPKPVGRLALRNMVLANVRSQTRWSISRRRQGSTSLWISCRVGCASRDRAVHPGSLHGQRGAGGVSGSHGLSRWREWESRSGLFLDGGVTMMVTSAVPPTNRPGGRQPFALE